MGYMTEQLTPTTSPRGEVLLAGEPARPGVGLSTNGVEISDSLVATTPAFQDYDAALDAVPHWLARSFTEGSELL